MSVGLFDEIIRTFYRVCEFTDDPACVLRVGLSPARAPVSLSDGTRVEIGGLVGTLHFGISICHALSPADPTPLGLRSAKPGPGRFMRWPFMSRANPLCGRYGRFAARPHCQPGSGYRRCNAWPNDSDLSEYRRTSPVVSGYMPLARAVPCGH